VVCKILRHSISAGHEAALVVKSVQDGGEHDDRQDFTLDGGPLTVDVFLSKLIATVVAYAHQNLPNASLLM